MFRFIRSRLIPASLIFGFLFGLILVTSFPGPAVAQSQKDKEGPKRKFDDAQMKEIAKWGNEATKEGWRNGGNYFSVMKLSLLMVTFWLWVATTGWVNSDTQRQVDLGRVFWNWLTTLTFSGAFLAALFIPIFWVGFPLVVLAWLIPVFVYVHHRNTGLLTAEKVMTPDHLSFFFRRKLGMNVTPPKPSYEMGSPIRLTGYGENVSGETANGRMIAARNHAGYNNLRELIYFGIQRGATAVRQEVHGDSTQFHFCLDGVWHQITALTSPNRETLSGEDGRDLLQAAKILCGKNPAEFQRRQTGEFLALYDDKKKLATNFLVQGKPGVEEAMFQFQFKDLPFKTLEALGMTDPRRDDMKAILNADRGLVILSATPGQGLRTFTNVAFNAADRFTRDFTTVEDVHKPYMPIENIQLNTYDSSKGETPMTVLPDVFFREPKVLLLRDLVNVETLKLCCEEVGNDRLIITTFRGRDSADTILRMLKTGVSPRLLADSLVGIVTQRLLRRLCPVCKEEIPVNPDILRRLGLPPGTVKSFYRKRVHPPVQPGQKDEYIPCEHCMDFGYRGRCGIYDVVFISDEIRQIIVSSPSAEAIRQAAVRSGGSGYMADGARLVANGVTSLDELVRVMKEPS